MNTTQQTILEKALSEFTTLTGVDTNVIHRKLLNINKETEPDFIVELATGQKKTRLWVEVKSEIREANLGDLADQFRKDQKEWLLICRYIPKPVKEKLKTEGINYMETAGNCFIRTGELFFYINDRAVTIHRQPKEGKLWKQAGLKFIFGILINPELINQAYRQIATETNIALGNIGSFLEELKQEGFLKEGTRNGKSFLFLENIEILQKKWIELFTTTLKPKLKQGLFRFINKEDEKNWQMLPATIPYKFYWGGEPAASILTGYLKPQIFTIYTNERKTNIMKQLRLVPDKYGNVEILDIFWKTSTPDFLTINATTVPAFLAYAELVNSLDSRNRETAERIKQQHLERTN